MKTRWGVIGSGGIARRRTIPEGITKAANAELIAVFDTNRAVNEEVAQQFGAMACESEADILNSDCEAVYIASPNYMHCEQAVRAAEAGKHILCEKPFGLTVAEAERMVTSCASHKVKLGIGFMMRFHAQHQEALKIIREGRLGQPTFARAQLSCWYPPIAGAWRQEPAMGGGGSLMDTGSHCIDLLEMFFGPVRTVFCLTGNLVQGYKSEDTAVVLLEFASGATGVVDSLYNVPDESSKNRLELYGSQGSILAEGTIGQGEAGEMVAYLKENADGYDAQQARDMTQGIQIVPRSMNMYRAEIEAFSDAVHKGAPLPVDAEAGLWSQRVIAACYESARVRKPVSIE